MNLFKKITVALLLAGFICNQVVEYFSVKIPWMYSYLDDLLSVPVTIGMYILLRSFTARKNEPEIDLPAILFACIAFSIHFEILMPFVSSKYTSDIFDVIMYFSGGLVTWVIYGSGFRLVKTILKLA